MVEPKSARSMRCPAIRMLFLSAVVLIIISACTASQNTSPPFSVSGVLLNDSDSSPVGGAFVIFEPQGDAATPAEASGSKSGPDGRFVIRNLSSAQYQIVVEKKGFLTSSRTFRHVDRGRQEGISGSSDDQVEIRLAPQAAIAGRVKDSAGEAIVGAVVQLSRMYLQGRRTALSPIAQVTTNDLGEYRMFNLPAGRYYIGASYQDQGSRLGLRLRRLAERNVLSDSGTEDYAVTYYPGNLDPEDATPVRARAGQVLSGIDIQVAMARSFSIAGVVTGVPPGTPMPEVFLQPPQPGGLGPLRVHTPVPGAKEFRFRSVAPGTYVVRTDVNVGGQPFSAREQIDLGLAPVENVVLDLRPPFSIAGRVLADGGGLLPKDLKLRLHGLDRRFLGPIKPNASGGFEVAVVGPDCYAVDAISDSGTAYVKSVSLDQQAVGVNGVTIRDPNHVLEIVVSDKAGRIEGKVLDSEQQPVTTGLVVLVGSDPQDPRSHALALSSEGGFVLKSLPPGAYRIACFSDLAASGDATWDVQKMVRTSGMKITVAEGEKQQVNLGATLADPL